MRKTRNRQPAAKRVESRQVAAREGAGDRGSALGAGVAALVLTTFVGAALIIYSPSSRLALSTNS